LQFIAIKNNQLQTSTTTSLSKGCVLPLFAVATFWPSAVQNTNDDHRPQVIKSLPQF